MIYLPFCSQNCRASLLWIATSLVLNRSAFDDKAISVGFKAHSLFYYFGLRGVNLSDFRELSLCGPVDLVFKKTNAIV